MSHNIPKPYHQVPSQNPKCNQKSQYIFRMFSSPIFITFCAINTLTAEDFTSLNSLLSLNNLPVIKFKFITIVSLTL